MTGHAPRLLLIARDADAGEALTSAGFAVLEVEDEAAALAHASDDVAMLIAEVTPSDFRICGRLREHPPFASLPIVLLCPSTLDDAARLAALESGADTALAWPAQQALLVASVRALLRSHHAAAELRERLAAEKQLHDAFLSTLGHELRTPLNSILGWADILVRQPRESDFSAGLQSIDRNARHQAQLITDLLDAARLSSGRLKLDVERVDAAPILDAALQAVGAAALAKNIEIVRTVAPVSIPLRADPARLQQVLGYLLGNAVKHTRKAGRIEVSLSVVDDRLQIVVSDNGIGIEADQLPALFDGFRRVAGGSRRSASLGLELLMVRQLAELHGGSVEARSAGKNQGASFTVQLLLAGRE